MVSTVLCPSSWVRDQLLRRYPNPERVVESPHPDVCHYDRAPLWWPVTNGRINLCIPHEVSYLKGELLLPRIAGVFNASGDHITVFGYAHCGYGAPNVFRNYIPKEQYDDDEFYELLNDHPEMYSYCFSKCVNTGLPCLYSDVNGAIEERVRRHGLSNMYPLDGELSTVLDILQRQQRSLHYASTSPTNTKKLSLCANTRPLHHRVTESCLLRCTTLMALKYLYRINYPTHTDFFRIPNAVQS